MNVQLNVLNVSPPGTFWKRPACETDGFWTLELGVSNNSTVELKGLVIQADIGTYGPGDVVPDAHVLDLTLWISQTLVLIKEDGMQHVFDYDPLIAAIDHLASETHYDTQERLMTRIVSACARYPAIEAVEIALSKSPVRRGTGSLGVRTRVDKPRWRRSGNTPRLSESNKSGQHPTGQCDVSQRDQHRSGVQHLEPLVGALISGLVDGGHQHLPRWNG